MEKTICMSYRQDKNQRVAIFTVTLQLIKQLSLDSICIKLSYLVVYLTSGKCHSLSVGSGLGGDEGGGQYNTVAELGTSLSSMVCRMLTTEINNL